MEGRGNTWRDSEVNALLEVWSNDAIQWQPRGSYRHEAMYRKNEAELAIRVKGVCTHLNVYTYTMHIRTYVQAWKVLGVFVLG